MLAVGKVTGKASISLKRHSGCDTPPLGIIMLSPTEKIHTLIAPCIIYDPPSLIRTGPSRRVAFSPLLLPFLLRLLWNSAAATRYKENKLGTKCE